MTDVQFGTFDGVATGVVGAGDTPLDHAEAYVAMGAFSGADGLVGAIDSLDDFNAYVLAMEAKTTEVSGDNVHLHATDATGGFLLMGGTGNDSLSGAGSSGGGLLVGGSGFDTLIGGAGNDTLEPGLGNDSIDGGGGVNTLSFANTTSGHYADADANNFLDGGGSVAGVNFQNLTGSAFDDTLYGSRFGDRIIAFGGDDKPNQANLIDGGAGRDLEFGAGGPDTLVSDGGGDRMSGGGGADVYVFTAFLDHRSGTMGNLHAGGPKGADTIDVSAAAAALGFDHFTEVTAFDGVAGEMTAIYQGPANDRTDFLFDTNGDGRWDYKIEALHGDHTGFFNFIGVDTSGVVT